MTPGIYWTTKIGHANGASWEARLDDIIEDTGSESAPLALSCDRQDQTILQSLVAYIGIVNTHLD